MLITVQGYTLNVEAIEVVSPVVQMGPDFGFHIHIGGGTIYFKEEDKATVHADHAKVLNALQRSHGPHYMEVMSTVEAHERLG